MRNRAESLGTLWNPSEARVVPKLRQLTTVLALFVFLEGIHWLFAPPVGAQLSCPIPMLNDRCALWESTIDERITDLASGVDLSPDGSRVYVTGHVGGSFVSTDWDMLTIAYNASTGQKKWTAVYDGPLGLGDAAFTIAAGLDGERVYVAGVQNLAGSPWQANAQGTLTVLCYDAVSGHQLWVATYDGPASQGDDRALDLAVGPGPDGDRVYVTGKSSGASSDDYITIALEGRSGARLWASRYDGPVGGSDEPTAIAVSGDGERVFVTGRSQGEPGGFSDVKLDFATVAYASGSKGMPGGEQLWVARHNGPGTGPDLAYSLAASPDGSAVFVVGGSSEGEEPTNGGCLSCGFVTFAYDAETGEERWDSRFEGPIGGDIAFAVAVSPDAGRVFVTGASVAALDDYVTVAYDSRSGNQEWVSRVPSPKDEIPRSIAVSPDGSYVYITGQSFVPAGIGIPTQWAQGDALTVAIRASDGTQAWVARHNAEPLPIDSYATPNLTTWKSLAVSPDGNTVFVARTNTHLGALFEEENGHDIATLAYPAR